MSFTASKSDAVPEGYLTNIGKATTYISTMKRLLSIDISHVRIPNYDKSDLFDFVHKKVGYKAFTADVDRLQILAHLPPVDRPTMEAAWAQCCVKKFGVWDDGALVERLGASVAFQKKQECIKAALEQRFGTYGDTRVEAYWMEKGKLYPGLDVEKRDEVLDYLENIDEEQKHGLTIMFKEFLSNPFDNQLPSHFFLGSIHYFIQLTMPKNKKYALNSLRMWIRSQYQDDLAKIPYEFVAPADMDVWLELQPLDKRMEYMRIAANDEEVFEGFSDDDMEMEEVSHGDDDAMEP